VADGSDALNEHVVNIDFYVSSDLISEHLIDESLVRGPGIF
jgi:hypothetical protein